MTRNAHNPTPSWMPGYTLPAALRTESKDFQLAAWLAEALARYLGEQEPHSPAPYLSMRGVSWWQMSLLELMPDISQDEADLRRYFGAIGVNLSAYLRFS